MSISRVVVLDTETSGLDPAQGAVVLELAWACVEYPSGTVVTSDEQLIHYSGVIPPEAKAVHHITEEQVRDPSLPTIDWAVKELLDAEEPGEMAYAAHNAAFDRAHLPQLSAGEAPLPWICTYRCAMHLYPDAPGHSNQVLRYWLMLDVDLPPGLYPHRALYDTLVTAALLGHMLETHTPEDLIRLTGEPVLLTKVRFGKHRGLLWSQVPTSYLSWCASQSDMDPDTLYTARHYLSR